MKLADLEQFNPITIQCHNSPDGDALGAGFGLYMYFKSRGKDVRLIYSGPFEIQKSNLKLMVEKLDIPVEYVPEVHDTLPGLLITVDCQYGAGNVAKLPAENVAIIDHHQIEITNVELSEIQSGLGSCSTLVWKMMKDAGYDFKGQVELGTALYYGLFTDTNHFAEIHNPLDMDMRDDLPCNHSIITLLRNSNLSLEELQIAGIALIRYMFNDDYNYAIVRAEPCDANLLGLISDLVLQVDQIHTCLVYNKMGNGFKFSVRSCIKEVRASELAAYLAKNLGSGGGHTEKAGGFISEAKYEEYYPTLHTEAYFSAKMNEYFDNSEVIYAANYDIDISDMACYHKKKLPLAYVKAEDVLPVGTPITIRTLEGDVEMIVEPDVYIMIGIKGEVYPNKREKFEKSYKVLGKKYNIEEAPIKPEYVPTIRNRLDGLVVPITEYAYTCLPTGDTHIHAKELTKIVKVFTAWDEERYMLGMPGDFLAVRSDDVHDIFIVERELFYQTYEKETEEPCH